MKSAFVVIYDPEKMLIFTFFDLKKKMLDLPGGKIDQKDRSINETAVRELREEAGKFFPLQSFVSICKQIRSQEPTVIHGHAALFFVSHPSFKTKRPAGWVKLDDIVYGENSTYKKFLRATKMIQMRFMLFRGAQMLRRRLQQNFDFVD